MTFPHGGAAHVFRETSAGEDHRPRKPEIRDLLGAYEERFLGTEDDGVTYNALNARIRLLASAVAGTDATNLAQVQALIAAAGDFTTALKTEDGGVTYDAHSRRIKNVANGVASNDAINVAQAQAIIAGGGAVLSESQVHASRTAMQSATIDVAIKTVIALGESTAGDGLEAIYKRVTSEPTSPLKVRSVDRFLPDGTSSAGNGGWWQQTSSLLSTEFADVASAEDALIPTSVEAIQTKGQTTPGIGGSVYIKKVSEPTLFARKFQSADGAWWQGSGPTLIPHEFADGVGVAGTDNTTALQQWLDEGGADEGALLLLPPGTYDATSVLRWGYARRIIGSSTSVIRGAHAGNVFNLQPYATGSRQGWEISGLRITNKPGDTPAAAIVMTLGDRSINYGSISAYHLSKPVFSNLVLDGCTDAIALDNTFSDGTPRDLNGGIFGAKFDSIWLTGNVKMIGCGDSNNFVGCIMSGTGILEISPVQGSAQNIVGPGNNITLTKGIVARGGNLRDYTDSGDGTDTLGAYAVSPYAATQIHVFRNQIETPTYDGVWEAAITFDNVNDGGVEKCNVNTYEECASFNLGGGAKNLKIDGNALAAATPNGNLLIRVIDEGIKIGDGNTYTYDGVVAYAPAIDERVADNAWYLEGVWLSAGTPLNAWAYTGEFSARRDGGRAFLRGRLQSGNTALATVINSTLPPSCRPSVDRVVGVDVREGTTLSRGLIKISTAGVMTIEGAAFAGNDAVYLDGVSYAI